MSDIKLSRDDIERIVHKVKMHFNDELDYDIGGFDAEFLIELFAKEIGPFFYNQGLSDAQTLVLEKTEKLGYLIQEMEKPII
ncbi:DUF2164 domain-containing protein [Marinobacterium stanieri]|nr:DUF2164 domain-containing protein [Marinobacterium stanieri]